jgi:hypothetical protein
VAEREPREDDDVQRGRGGVGGVHACEPATRGRGRPVPERERVGVAAGSFFDVRCYFKAPEERCEQSSYIAATRLPKKVGVITTPRRWHGGGAATPATRVPFGSGRQHPFLFRKGTAL